MQKHSIGKRGRFFALKLLYRRVAQYSTMRVRKQNQVIKITALDTAENTLKSLSSISDLLAWTRTMVLHLGPAKTHVPWLMLILVFVTIFQHMNQFYLLSPGARLTVKSLPHECSAHSICHTVSTSAPQNLLDVAYESYVCLQFEQFFVPQGSKYQPVITYQPIWLNQMDSEEVSPVIQNDDQLLFRRHGYPTVIQVLEITVWSSLRDERLFRVSFPV